MFTISRCHETPAERRLTSSRPVENTPPNVYVGKLLVCVVCCEPAPSWSSLVIDSSCLAFLALTVISATADGKAHGIVQGSLHPTFSPEKKNFSHRIYVDWVPNHARDAAVLCFERTALTKRSAPSQSSQQQSTNPFESACSRGA